jgi:hypothetical protein
MTEQKPMTVYVLQHSHELDGCDETKLIGLYSSPGSAEGAQQSARQRRPADPGKGDRPR